MTDDLLSSFFLETYVVRVDLRRPVFPRQLVPIVDAHLSPLVRTAPAAAPARARAVVAVRGAAAREVLGLAAVYA